MRLGKRVGDSGKDWHHLQPRLPFSPNWAAARTSHLVGSLELEPQGHSWTLGKSLRGLPRCSARAERVGVLFPCFVHSQDLSDTSRSDQHPEDRGNRSNHCWVNKIAFATPQKASMPHLHLSIRYLRNTTGFFTIQSSSEPGFDKFGSVGLDCSLKLLCRQQVCLNRHASYSCRGFWRGLPFTQHHLVACITLPISQRYLRPMSIRHTSQSVSEGNRGL